MYFEAEYLDDSYFENVLESNNEINNDALEVERVDQIKRKKKTENGLGLANKKIKKNDLKTDEKKTLCFLVSKQRRIWDLEDDMHKNVNAIASAWKQIAQEMKKSVEECKSAWKSLKDSLRYHKTRARKVGRSGSSAEIDLELNDNAINDDIEWEFIKDMAFLESALPENKRRTFSTSTSKDEEGDDDTNTSSNYSYMSKRNSNNIALLSRADKLTESISELIASRANKPTSNQYKQKHEIMLNNIDRMLQKLPDEVVDELNLKFQIQIMDEMKKNNN